MGRFSRSWVMLCFVACISYPDIASSQISKDTDLDQIKIPTDRLFLVEITVIRIIDADTFVAKLHLVPHLDQEHVIRVRGIDAPETSRVCKAQTDLGNAAEAYLETLLSNHDNKAVALIYDSEATDKYGRYLADVFLGEPQETIFSFFNQTDDLRWDELNISLGQSIASTLIAEGHGVRLENGAKETETWGC